MKIIKEIINYLVTELPRTKGTYMTEEGDDIVFYNRENNMLTVNFLYTYGDKPPFAKQDILDSIDKIVGTKHIHQNIVIFDSGLRVHIQYRYTDIDKRVTRPSMRTLLGLK